MSGVRFYAATGDVFKAWVWVPVITPGGKVITNLASAKRRAAAMRGHTLARTGGEHDGEWFHWLYSRSSMSRWQWVGDYLQTTKPKGVL